MFVQPFAKMDEGQAIEKGAVGCGELPYEGHDGHVRHVAFCSTELSVRAQYVVELLEKLLACISVCHGVAVVPLGIFIAIEIQFEGAIAARNQRVIRVLEPTFRVVLLQHKMHYIETLLENLTIIENNNRHGSFGGGRQHGGRLIR